jgi:hypothetical protein
VRRPSIVLAAVLCALVTGCSEQPSPVDDDAKVTISSRVTAAGRPVSEARVSLQSSGSVSDLVQALPGVSLVCLLGDCEARPDRELRSGSDGGLSISTNGRHTKTTGGGARWLSLTAADPDEPADARTGGAATLAFQVLSEKVDLPPLSLWRTPLRIDLAAGVVTFQPPPVAADVELLITDAQGNLVEQRAGSSTRARFDPRLLEDLPVEVTLVATRKVGGVTQVWRSPVVDAKGTRRPLTRGLPCGAEGPCALTDGRLALHEAKVASCADVPEGAETCALGDRRVLDLGTARPLQLVVVRGLAAVITVEASVDGKAWTRLAPYDTGPPERMRDVVVQRRKPGAGPVRYLRVESTSSLAEVSAW